MKTIILTGGGTAGHVFGNVALLKKLETFFDKIVYIGSENGIEKDIISKYKNIKYIPIKTTKLVRKFTLKNLAIPFVLLKGINECKKIIDQTEPSIIFSKGGYVSIPVVIAGNKKKIPVILHESDLSLGLANKITKNKAKVVCTSFLDTSKKLKNGIWSGSPIRPQIFCGDKEKTLKLFNVPQNAKVLLVVGGSLGANSLNSLVWNNLDFLCSRFFVIHLTGRNKAQNITHPNYRQMEFCDHMEHLLSITNFALTRGGSNAIFEFLALKIPMLIAPLPKSISRGDQIENANYFENMGFSLTLNNETKEELEEKIENLLKNKEKFIENMNNYPKQDAIEIIFNQIKKFS